MADTPAKNAQILAERLRKKIEATIVQHEDMEIPFTISIGIAELNDEIETYKQWLEYSDQALYQCKEGGRNQSRIYQGA